MSDLVTIPEPRRLDVSTLPPSGFDSSAPAWWGNALLMMIETTTVALVLTTYFYLMRNYEQWPPPLTDQHPPVKDPLPFLGHATIDLVLVALSCIPMYVTDQFARRKSTWGVRLGLLVMLAISGVAIYLRFKEFPDLRVRWDTNAYGSTVWTILGLHLTYYLAGAAEFLVMGAWAMTHDLDDKHALDVTLAGGYWYWVAATWVLCYAVVYWVPRWT